MEWIVPISIAVGTGAFVILVYFAIRALIALRRAIDALVETTGRLELKVEQLSNDVGAITETVHDELEAIRPLMNSVRNVGEFLEDTSQGLVARIEKKKPLGWQERIAKSIELMALSALVWKQLKR